MKKFALISLALLAFAPAAMADISVAFDMNNAQLKYDLSSNLLTVYETSGETNPFLNSVLTMNKKNGLPILDTVYAGNGSFDFLMDLTPVKVGANWDATGTLTVKDKTGNKVIEAAVDLSELKIDGGFLQMTGALSDLSSNPTILLGSDPWVFEGDAGSDDSKITVNNALSFDAGEVITIRFGMAGITLDSLFTTPGLLPFGGGIVTGEIVPLPGAVLLGAMGLGLVGWVRKRFA